MMPVNIKFESRKKIKDISKLPSYIPYDKLKRHINFGYSESSYSSGWVKSSNGYYYFKDMFPIRELLMSELYNDNDIETVDFSLVSKDSRVGVLSKNFRTFDYDYNRIDELLNKKGNYGLVNSDTLGVDCLSNYFEKSFDEEDSLVLTDKLTRMLALDFLTGQADRYARNIMVKTFKKTGKTSLCPLTDNGVCFRPYKLNVFIGFIDDLVFPDVFAPLGDLRTLNVIKSTPKFKSELERALDIDFNRIIIKTEDKHLISIDEDAKNAMLEIIDSKKSIIDQSLKLIK